MSKLRPETAVIEVEVFIFVKATQQKAPFENRRPLEAGASARGLSA
jgi:hypothetical protein